MSRITRSIATIALVAGLFAAFTPLSARADIATTSSATATSPTSVTVTWGLAPGTATSWVVLATRSSDGAIVGMQTVCATCTSARFDYLTPGLAYRFTIAGLGTPDGTVWGSATAATPRDPLCGTTTSCVAVDARTAVGASTGVGLGLLSGLTAGTAQGRIAPLALNYHRIAAWQPGAFDLARAAGGQIDVVISAAWPRYTLETFGRHMNPWEDWDAYRQFIVGIVGWHLDHGQVPDFWEIQNEPDQAAWYRSTAPGMEPTRARVLEQFTVAHDTIRSVLPDAKIVGPSVGSFYPMSGALVDLVAFLDNAVARNLRFDVLAWHEMGGDCGGTCSGGPRGIAQNVATLRNLLAQRPSLGQPAVHVNEFGGPKTVASPGFAAGYLAALAATGVDRAGSSCWPVTRNGRTTGGCYDDPGTMDNLLLADGSSPSAAWWVWRAYAQMAGTRLAGSSSVVESSVHATLSPSGAIDVLVGRHGGTTTATGARVRVAVPTAVSRVRVEITPIPAVNGASTPATTSTTLRVSGGVVDLSSLSLPAGGAVVLEITGANTTSRQALSDLASGTVPEGTQTAKTTRTRR